MPDLSDVNMEGVKPMGAGELPVGQYLVRIEDSEKKETKEKFDTDGTKLPQAYYLQISKKVYGGPNDGQVDFTRLNLWNSNPTAVNMAKSELKSIQDATGVVSPNSDDFHGKWMIMEVKAGIKDPEKLFKNYSAAPAGLVQEYAHVPAVSVRAASPAPTATTSAPPYIAKEAAAAGISTPTSSTSNPAAVPDWARKKVG